MENNIDYNHKILNLYENSDFFKVYGLDFWISIIFVIISIILIIFIYITNHFNKIKHNWHKERCNPLYLPFAGYINPQSDKTNLEYTYQNFKYCNNKFIKKAENEVLDPIYHLINTITDIFQNIQDAWKSLLAILNLLKNKLGEIAEIVVDKLIGILIPIQFMFIKAKDTIGKMNGALVASIYTFYNLYKVIKLYLLNIIQITTTEVFIVSITTLLSSIAALLALLAIWLVLTALAAVAWLFAPILVAAASALMFGMIIPLMITIGIMLIFDIILWICLKLLNNFANEIYNDVNTPDVPKVPTKINSKDIKDSPLKSKNPLKSSNSLNSLKLDQ